MRLPTFLAAAMAVATLSLPASLHAAGPLVDVAAFARNDAFDDLKISPGGQYLAATVPLEDRTVLVILDRSGKKITGTLNLGRDTDIADFEWVNPERVLVSSGRKFGSLDAPLRDGNLYGLNVDGSKTDILVGQDVVLDVRQSLGSKIKSKKMESVAAFLVDDLPLDDGTVLISTQSFAADTFSRAERMDVYTGKRITEAHSPVRNATFSSDNAGVIRFVRGSNTDNVDQLYYRKGGNQSWALVNDEGASGRIERPIGFSADNAIAYLQVERPSGPDVIVSMDVANGARKDVLVDALGDPGQVIHAPGTSIPIGVRYTNALPRTAFFDPASVGARLQRSLEAAFPGQAPVITSATADGKLALVLVGSDTNPGDFYVFDTIAKKAELISSRAGWIDPAKMGKTRAISLVARDGLPLHGFLTIPNGSDGKNLPMVVFPHGGPIGVHDEWGFDPQVQLLAAAGYGVLQLDYRGSDNHGRAFQQAGAQQWGKAMQDDLTDATRWAVAQGVANGNRICISGASYGAYAALMGVAREPTLYKCAAGYVGVYDLAGMYNSGDTPGSASGKTYLREWLGNPETLASVSPNLIAGQIKAPVFLAAGGEDKRAPIKQTRMMEMALGSAGVPVETLYYANEGHGFYKVEHREAFYTQLLAFLSRNIGGATAAPKAADANKAK